MTEKRQRELLANGGRFDLEPNSLLLGRILEAGIKFHDWLWSSDPDEIEKKLNQYPEGFRYKMASFAMFFNRAVPSKSMLFHGRLDGPGKKVTPEQLEKAGLSDEQLKKIAGVE